jgi:hypothetical protein
MKKTTLLISVTAVSCAVALAVIPVQAAPASLPAKAAPQTITGVGDDVPAIARVKDPIIITLSHQGESNFIVKPVGANGEEGFSWANEIGPWQGTTFQEMNDFFSRYGAKNPIVALSVQADGPWNISIKPLGAAPRQALKSGKGTGESVVRFRSTPKGLTRITLQHDGESNFIVKPITASGKTGFSLVNEIGPYRGTKILPPGTQYLWVNADGNWSYTTRK